jgi:hypothetical protein
VAKFVSFVAGSFAALLLGLFGLLLVFSFAVITKIVAKRLGG